jgi:D-alanine-D-alanine ligase-like ATP-grasp enzyme
MYFLKLPYCEECGEVRLPHRTVPSLKFFKSKSSDKVALEENFARSTRALENIFAQVLTPSRVLSIGKFLSRFRIVTCATEPKAGDNTRTLALYEGALPSGVTLYALKVLGVPICFVAEKNVEGRIEQILFDIIPRPKNFVSPSLPWMDNKGILKQKLVEAELPCAIGGVATTLDEALSLFRSIGRPVITKPHTGSRGRHTTLDIRDEDELAKAFAIAQQLSEEVVVEAYLKGTVHRVTLIGGEPVAIARREYPHVIGDGVRTILELIEIENNAPYRNGVHFRKIDTEHRIAESLKKQSLTLESIPEAGYMVILNDKNSRLHGTLTEDVTDTVHPENIALFKRLGVMLADPIVGVDFMITDMKRSWKEQPDAGFIECNSMPFIDVHHRVVSGKQINVAEHLWNEVFKSKQ